MRTRLAALVLLAAAVAGCLAPSPTPGDGDGSGMVDAVPADWPERALPDADSHDHADPAQHRNRSTPNFERVGWNPLITDYHGETSGGYLCGGTATNASRDIAVTHSFSSDVALVVTDVSDPANPKKLGELVLPNVHVYDVDVLPDASHAVLATSPLDAGPDADGTLTLEPRSVDACGNRVRQGKQQVPYSSGVVLVDLSDPSQPEVVDYQSQPLIGAHSVFATTIDGTDYVLGSTTNLDHQTSYFSFWTVDETPAGGQLVEYGTFTAQYPDAPQGQPPLTNGHVDGWIRKHPETGQTLAYLANWNGGMVVVELAGQGRIQPVSQWNDYDPDAGAEMTGQIHGTLPMPRLWNGTHYTFVGQEVGGHPANRPTGQVIMLDTTDPANPTPVARWTLPVDVQWSGGLQFSTHYFTVVDRTLFVSLYHGGIWAVDVEPPVPTELRTRGVYLPTEVSPRPPTNEGSGPFVQRFEWTPVVLDVLPVRDGNGTLVAFDGNSGAYTLQFDDTGDVPTPDPWMKDAWIEGGSG